MFDWIPNTLLKFVNKHPTVTYQKYVRDRCSANIMLYVRLLLVFSYRGFSIIKMTDGHQKFMGVHGKKVNRFDITQAKIQKNTLLG